MLRDFTGIIMLAFATMALVMSCGLEEKPKTKKIKKIRKVQTEESVIDSITPGQSSATTIGSNSSQDATSGTQQSSGTSGKVTCWGASSNPYPGFIDMCNQFPQNLQDVFSEVYQSVCLEKTLVNLIFAPCGWSGDASTQSKYMRILDMTDLESPDSKFNINVAYAMTTEGTLEDHLELLDREFVDSTFADTFDSLLGDNMTYRQKMSEGNYQYTVEVVNSAMTIRWSGDILISQINEDMFVVFDYSTGNNLIVDSHVFFRAYIRDPNNKTRIIAVVQEVVDDGGNHIVAYENIISIIRDLMKDEFNNVSY